MQLIFRGWREAAGLLLLLLTWGQIRFLEVLLGTALIEIGRHLFWHKVIGLIGEHSSRVSFPQICTHHIEFNNAWLINLTDVLAFIKFWCLRHVLVRTWIPTHWWRLNPAAFTFYKKMRRLYLQKLRTFRQISVAWLTIAETASPIVTCVFGLVYDLVVWGTWSCCSFGDWYFACICLRFIELWESRRNRHILVCNISTESW